MPPVITSVVHDASITKPVTETDEAKKRKTFADSDDVAGWADSSRDERLWKFIRPQDKKVADTAMPYQFDVVKTFEIPPPMLVDPDEVIVVDGVKKVDHGDVYEAFWRSPSSSIRGIFANGEPIWGTAEYYNGMSYTGMFKGGIPDGFGEKRSGASVYKGRFKHGLRDGRGLLFEANHNRLYMGTFVEDKPDGIFLCIVFSWSTTKKSVVHTRSALQFKHGELLSFEKNTAANVTTLTGLCYEEFLKFYREGEKHVEDTVVRKRLRDMGAEETLWHPPRCEQNRQMKKSTVETTGVSTVGDTSASRV
jgi:hypothetical protein